VGSAASGAMAIAEIGVAGIAVATVAGIVLATVAGIVLAIAAAIMAGIAGVRRRIVLHPAVARRHRFPTGREDIRSPC
jgi:hypothetical protein